MNAMQVCVCLCGGSGECFKNVDKILAEAVIQGGVAVLFLSFVDSETEQRSCKVPFLWHTA